MSATSTRAFRKRQLLLSGSTRHFADDAPSLAEVLSSLKSIEHDLTESNHQYVQALGYSGPSADEVLGGLDVNHFTEALGKASQVLSEDMRGENLKFYEVSCFICYTHGSNQQKKHMEFAALLANHYCQLSAI